MGTFPVLKTILLLLLALSDVSPSDYIDLDLAALGKDTERNHAENLKNFQEIKDIVN